MKDLSIHLRRLDEMLTALNYDIDKQCQTAYWWIRGNASIARYACNRRAWGFRPHD